MSADNRRFNSVELASSVGASWSRGRKIEKIDNDS